MISALDEQIRDLQGSEDEEHLITGLLEERRHYEELRKTFSRELRRIII